MLILKRRDDHDVTKGKLDTFYIIASSLEFSYSGIVLDAKETKELYNLLHKEHLDDKI